MRFFRLSKSELSKVKGMNSISLHSYLTRLICLSILPLFLLVVIVGFTHLHTLRNQRDEHAAEKAKDVANAIDRHIDAQISGLQLLANSPLVDDPSRFSELYTEALGFRDNFGGHVILADPSRQMLFNTRVAFGQPLPGLPVQKGHPAADTVMITGKPATTDVFFGPVANEPLVSIVVPLNRDKRIKYLLLSTIDVRQFQQTLDKVAIPTNWAVSVLDRRNELIAQRAPAGFAEPINNADSAARFIAKSTVSDWTAVVEIPPGVYRSPIYSAAGVLVLAIFVLTVATVIGGRLASRRLAQSVKALSEMPLPPQERIAISEIEAVRQNLESSAELRKAAEDMHRESEERLRLLGDNLPESAIYQCIQDADGNVRFLYFSAGIERLNGVKVEDVLSDATTLYRQIQPEYFERLAEAERRSAREMSDFDMEVPMNLSNGETRWMRLHSRPRKLPDGRVIWDGVQINITEHKRTEARMASDLTALTRMHELSGRLLEAGELQPLLQEIMDSAVLIMSADMGTLQLLEDNSLRIVAAHGHQQAFLDFFESAENKASVCGDATRRGERIIVPDVETSSLFAGTPSLEVLQEAGIRAVQSTPLMRRNGSLLGILTTQWKIPFTPDEHDLWRIDLLARQAADLIEHSRAEEALRKAHEFTKSIFDTVDGLIIVLDRQGRIVRFNAACERLTGWPADEVMGNCFWEFLVPEEQREGVIGVFNELTSGMFPNRHENDWVMRDGSRRWVAWANSAVLDNSGGIEYVIGTGIDISERRKAEQALFDTNQRLQALMMALPVGVSFSEDATCQSITGNPAVLAQFEVGAKDNLSASAPDPKAPGRQVRFYKDGQEINDCELPLQRAVAERREIQPMELRCLLPSGREWYMEASGSPILNAQGEIIGGVAVTLDISQRKLMEEELRQSRDELELRVQERTKELKDYMARLKESNQALQDFASIAAHDLQEPLRKVQTFGSMVKQRFGDALGEQGNSYMERVLDANQRMQSLLTALLEYSRLTTRANPFEPVKISNIIQEVLSDLEVRIEKTGGTVLFDNLPVIYADPIQMRQLFQNLVGNALKFHKHSENPVVMVRCIHSATEYCRIEVQDNGIGFDQEFAEKIFAPFQRLHGKSSLYEGTGMGLAICKKIIERHGGSIVAKSIPGTGSTFIITLPITIAGGGADEND